MFARACAVFILLAVVLEASAQPATRPAAAMTVDKATRTIVIPALIAPRKLDYLKDIYPIEVIACWPHPKGKKAHETVVTIEVAPSELHKALESLGLKPGKPATAETPAEGPELRISIELTGADGQARRLPIEKTLVDRKTGLAMPTVKWLFTGSVMSQPNPEKDEKFYGADLTGTLICVFPVTDQTVIQSNLSAKDEPLLKMETNKKILPPEGTPVKLIIEAR